MKEKRSNMNQNVEIDDEQHESLLRLIGLFLIVYSILCFTSGHMGSILGLPLTFLFGSFSYIALLILLIVGLFLLFFKKYRIAFSVVQYILLIIMLLFLLSLATSTKVNAEMTFSNCFDKYIGKENGVFKTNYSFILANDREYIMQLGGGMIGYMVYGLLNSITNKNTTITIAISTILFLGALFIFVYPFIKRFIKWCKKINSKNKEKRAIKKQKLIEKQKIKEAKNNSQTNYESDAEFEMRDLSRTNSTNKQTNYKNNADTLIEEATIDIKGNNYNYNNKNQVGKTKLENLLNTFDDEIYGNRNKLNTDDNVIIEKNNTINDLYMDDFNEIEKSKNSYDMSDRYNQVKSQINFNKQNDTDIEVTKNENNPYDMSDRYNQVKSQINFNKQNDTDIEVTKNENNPYDMSDRYNQVKSQINFNKQNDNTFIINNINEEPATNEVTNKTMDVSNYELPPLYLLKDYSSDGTNDLNEEIAREKAGILLEKMHELNVNATINAYVIGPSVTRFEIALAPGVRVNSFTNLQEDFKLALGVSSVRIESPIPGKAAIGIEIPNVHRAMVGLKEVIMTMPKKKEKLYVPIGKDITGTPLSFAICNMPHCLICGATNSGKSVCANSIILSLLMNYKPNEVRFIMVDPKKVEMLFYKDIPHLLCPIITESEKARVALEKLCLEMDRRFTYFSAVGVKNIASYNEKMELEKKEKMPFIILVVDEFAELMLCKSKNIVEEKIQKLAQLGRAAGIHLVLSTQRPDVNIISGSIKANLPCRMTFRLSSLVDSRTVIDCGGAEKLLNNGDMLLITPDFTGLRRVQGVYVSDKEIDDVVEFCKNQLPPQYDPKFMDLRIEQEIQDEEKLKYMVNQQQDNDATNDDLYNQVKDLVITEQKASTSYLQRKFGIGYQKAARYIDMLEEEGIVGPENGSKPREVLISNDDDEYEEN
ncbi:MAG: DNA translocase FtsK [Candidatus Caccosoma sp.]|nr:DNA translocase FtsK [Candidatus Caccosoma sp.]